MRLLPLLSVMPSRRMHLLVVTARTPMLAGSAERAMCQVIRRTFPDTNANPFFRSPFNSCGQPTTAMVTNGHSAQAFTKRVCLRSRLDGIGAESWFVSREARTCVRPRALLWQSRIRNKTRIPHVPHDLLLACYLANAACAIANVVTALIFINVSRLHAFFLVVPVRLSPSTCL